MAWKGSTSIAFYERKVRKAIEESERTGNSITLEPLVAQRILEIVQQAKHTEIGHGV